MTKLSKFTPLVGPVFSNGPSRGSAVLSEIKTSNGDTSHHNAVLLSTAKSVNGEKKTCMLTNHFPSKKHTV